MINQSIGKILGRVPPREFIGRDAEIERILAESRRNDGGLVLLATPGVGASELLRQAYDRLFAEAGNVIPFYFELRAEDGSGADAASRFLREFLRQSVAFRRQDANIVAASSDITEIVQLASPEDGHWIDRLVESLTGGQSINEASLIRSSLSAPIRARGAGARSFVMIDGLSAAAALAGGERFLSSLHDVLSNYAVPFVVAGRRRDLFAKMPFETMALDSLSIPDSASLVEAIAEKNDVPITDETRDLIAVQVGGQPSHLRALLSRGRRLETFDAVEKAYADEIFGGRLARGLDTILDGFPQPQLLDLLITTLNAASGTVPRTLFEQHLGPQSIDVLNSHEIINATAGVISIDSENLPLVDYLSARASLEIDGVPRALAIGNAIYKYVKRAPQLMARYYRRSHAVGLRELMAAFSGQSISSGLIDYRRFRNEFKGDTKEHILETAFEDDIRITLPRIIFTADTSGFYRRMDRLMDSERSAVALGFTDAETETVWIAAEIDAKLEADAATANYWCDRLEMVALNSNFQEYRLWLISPEGFTDEALDVIDSRNGHGSSRRQVSFLAQILETGADGPEHDGVYEIMAPTGEATELMSAHAVEDIARQYGFEHKAINQIKTALVEACINAAEHSLSPDKRINQKFAFDGENLTITVSNRGIRLADRPAAVQETQRRGWGLKLMCSLMDEVEFERTDDGTKIVMVKRLDKRAA